MAENERKVSYLLNLLGRKRTAKETEDDTPLDSDSDYEDMIATTPISHKANLIESIAKSHTSFDPSLSSVTDDYDSQTTIVQDETEDLILESFKEHPDLAFNYSGHKKYIEKSLNAKLPAGYFVLDPNHPWMMYWLYNALNVITIDDEIEARFAELVDAKISSCIIDNGLNGIAGGANQLGHVAATYAGILALVSTKNYEVLTILRPNLYRWYLSLKREDGSFSMHVDGESDTRSTYCVLVVCSLLNMLTPEITQGTLEWLNRCQTYEGGFAGTPDTEAHGGYTFCAVASYFLLFADKAEFHTSKSFNLASLIRWSVQRQYQVEGGVSGRTNKLVDACYSFWIGALFPLLESISNDIELFNRDGLRNYILRCAQADQGGFRDKPGKLVDFYHTNYTLCGLSICEHLVGLTDQQGEDPLAFNFKVRGAIEKVHTKPVNPVFGLPIEVINEARINLNVREGVERLRI
ncbi:beta subunit of protein farnesyltransferase [Suhomyces tanzawaensis NRRL Y-17324]|uniref:Protein farnesyltransferase subunit beta n=1 Tax=Suhomyces tanzawaensis NRRL Y-17324 TaxID=984487 RepID=A0A1E4SFC3_9ASCO|nr:beta subunit of protein farnesyltransferase [Suhomyces tanzawaensis NRRL Y-17324]ODV78150.1 beta subunit of protein farnesyltransferase [Suhomyces tanzawaensis NRRL Y-17324]